MACHVRIVLRALSEEWPPEDGVGTQSMTRPCRWIRLRDDRHQRYAVSVFPLVVGLAAT